MQLDPDICYRALVARDARFDGRFFVAVSTTRIYCRPICPARTPHPDHVTFYPTAAAAEDAGYRPCLRCRPETAPDIGAWRGTSNTVSRAMALIETGALDDGDVEGLAARLGLGGRQLRRLFEAHLGASPLRVAQTRRVHLAKQLIHDTDLSMTEVAMAAGFGSVRRFNDTFRRLYRRPPGALRHRGSAAADSAIRLTLAYKPPYDWEAIIAFLAARAIPGVETVEAGCYRRTFANGAVEVRHEPQRHRLAVAIRCDEIGILPATIARLRRVFDLVADPEAIAAHLGRDPVLAPLLARRPGLRLPGAWDGFEMAVRAIIGQQITVAGACNLLGKLVAVYGVPVAGGEDGLTHRFPTSDRLVGAEIASLGMPGARGRAIANLARAAIADPALLDRAASLDESIAALRVVPGIGDWTAHYIALRALREPDAFPASDVGLLRAMATDGVRPTPRDLLARAEAWRPWRGYAAQHLWAGDAAAALTEAPKIHAKAPSEEQPDREAVA
ncbi:MAG: AlkA N-terminal domain-containing protein [Stellaceae bacterium]